MAELRRLGRALPGDVRVVVVDGKKQACCATFRPTVDDGDAVVLPPAEMEHRITLRQEAIDWLEQPDLVSIAVVRGRASGVLLQAALACDLRALAGTARLAFDEFRRGPTPELGGTKHLVDLVGYARALEICVTGREVPASEAERIGLATTVVAEQGLDAAVHAVVAAVVAAPRDAVIELKALLAAAGRHSPAQHLAAEREAAVRGARSTAERGE